MTIVAHSMGTQETFYGLVHNKTYFENSINFMVALGPNVRITKISYLNEKAAMRYD